MEGFGFFMFLSVCVGGGIISHIRQQRNKLELLRLSIEKGLTLDPALIDKLMPTAVADRPSTPAQVVTGLRIGGIMCLAVAVGLPTMGYFLGRVNEQAFPALQGVGALLACISVGLFIASIVAARKSKDADHAA